MKKFALILCLALLSSFILSACGENTLTGTWYGELDLSLVAQEMFSEIGEDFRKANYKGIKVGMFYEFKEDGTYKMYLDKNSFEDLSETMLKKLRKPLLAYLETLAEEMNVNLSDILKAKDMSEDELLIGMIESVDIIGVLGNIDAELYYKTQGNKLFSADTPEALSKASFYVSFELSGNNLRFISNSREEEGKDAASRDIFWEVLKETKFKRK